jgi:hypothetical protein
MSNFTPEELKALRDQHESWLATLPGFKGTGIGMDRSGRLSLKVYSNQMPPEARNAIAERLGSVPVAIEETGEIRKQPTQKS